MSFLLIVFFKKVFTNFPHASCLVGYCLQVSFFPRPVVSERFLGIWQTRACILVLSLPDQLCDPEFADQWPFTFFIYKNEG